MFGKAYYLQCERNAQREFVPTPDEETPTAEHFLHTENEVDNRTDSQKRKDAEEMREITEEWERRCEEARVNGEVKW